jgi:putative ABC transport system permease protein
MRFSTLIFRNVFRRRVRSTLTITGMAVAVAAVVALVGLADGLTQSMSDIYEHRHVALIITRIDTFSPVGSTMTQKVGEALPGIPGVAGYCMGLLEFTQIEDFGSEMVTLQGWQPGAYMFNELKIISGTGLTEESRGKNMILIGAKIASIKNVKVGDEINMGEVKHKVAGIFQSSEDMENGMIITFLEDAQKITGKIGLITGCTIVVDKEHNNPASIAAIASEIDGPIAEKCKLKGRIAAKQPSAFIAQNNQLRAATGMAWATSAVALLIGGIGVLNTMVMSVFERTREIGILRAIGWRSWRILSMILGESVLLSIGGGIVGTAAGLGLISALSGFAAVGSIVHASITPQIVVKGFVVAMVVGLVGAAWPAYRGSQLLPTEALRHE